MRWKKTMTELQDSGARTNFDTGAQREEVEGRGRCDLLPLSVVGEIFGSEEIKNLDLFIKTRDKLYLYCAIDNYVNRIFEDDMGTALLELSIQFEQGAAKYSDRNWENGVPLHRYFDSAVRHWLKHERGDTDERHDRAFLWNVVCAIWTFENHPEMDDLPVYNKTIDDDSLGTLEKHIPVPYVPTPWQEPNITPLPYYPPYPSPYWRTPINPPYYNWSGGPFTISTTGANINCNSSDDKVKPE